MKMCEYCPPSKKSRIHKCKLCGSPAPAFPRTYYVHKGVAYPICGDEPAPTEKGDGHAS